MVFIGLGISTLSASGQKKPEQRPPMRSKTDLFKQRSETEEFRLRLAQGIERKINDVLKVSDLQISQSDGESDVFVTFTAETTMGVFEEVQCQMSDLTHIQDENSITLPGSKGPRPMPRFGFYLKDCQSSETIFGETAIPFYLDRFFLIRWRGDRKMEKK